MPAPVEAAAPEKITPLINRLRDSLEFTELVPFLLLDCAEFLLQHRRVLYTLILSFDTMLFG